MSVPTLRFPEFTGEWEKKKFGEIYSYRSTNSFSRDNLNYENGQVKNIHYGDIHTKFNLLFDITREVVPFVNSEISLDKLANDNFCKKGDLIIADASEDYADIGKCIEIVNLNNEKVIAGLHTIHARPKIDKISFGYSGHMMKSEKVRTQIMTFAQGTKVLSISMGRLSDMKLNLPTLPEQAKIANFLTAVDKKIAGLVNQISLQEQYRSGMMQRIFLQEISFKDDNGEDYPEWEEKTLGEVCKIYDGTHQTPNYKNKGVPFYSVEHLTANNFTVSKFISEDVFEKENKRVKLEKGDILMTRIGNIGTAKYINWDIKASFYVSLALLKKSEKHNNEFICHYIKSTLFQAELHKRTIHVAFPKKINLGEIGECLIKLPNLTEQTKIANFLSSLDTKISATRKQVDIAKEWKKGLLQQMFVSNDAVEGTKTVVDYPEMEGEMLVAAEVK